MKPPHIKWEYLKYELSKFSILKINELHKFYSELFSKKVKKSEQECSEFLGTINVALISKEHKICDKILPLLDDLPTSLRYEFW